jgi:hypothetical protein
MSRETQARSVSKHLDMRNLLATPSPSSPFACTERFSEHCRITMRLTDDRHRQTPIPRPASKSKRRSPALVNARVQLGKRTFNTRSPSTPIYVKSPSVNHRSPTEGAYKKKSRVETPDERAAHTKKRCIKYQPIRHKTFQSWSEVEGGLPTVLRLSIERGSKGVGITDIDRKVYDYDNPLVCGFCNIQALIGKTYDAIITRGYVPEFAGLSESRQINHQSRIAMMSSAHGSGFDGKTATLHRVDARLVCATAVELLLQMTLRDELLMLRGRSIRLAVCNAAGRRIATPRDTDTTLTFSDVEQDMVTIAVSCLVLAYRWEGVIVHGAVRQPLGIHGPAPINTIERIAELASSVLVSFDTSTRIGSVPKLCRLKLSLYSDIYASVMSMLARSTVLYSFDVFIRHPVAVAMDILHETLFGTQDSMAENDAITTRVVTTRNSMVDDVDEDTHDIWNHVRIYTEAHALCLFVQHVLQVQRVESRISPHLSMVHTGAALAVFVAYIIFNGGVGTEMNFTKPDQNDTTDQSEPNPGWRRLVKFLNDFMDTVSGEGQVDSIRELVSISFSSAMRTPSNDRTHAVYGDATWMHWEMVLDNVVVSDGARKALLDLVKTESVCTWKRVGVST